MDAFGIKLTMLSAYVEPNIEKMMGEIEDVVRKYNFATGKFIKHGEWESFIRRMVHKSELQD